MVACKNVSALLLTIKSFVLGSYLLGFCRDRKANVTMVFGLMSVMIMIGAGASIDLTRAYMARQKLVQTAMLACQYAGRPSVIDTSATSYSGTGGGAAYVTAVNNFITSTLASQNIQYTQTTGSPFTYTQNGAANVALTATVPTAFMKLINISQMHVGASSHCYDNINTLPQRVASNSSPNILTEGFENMPCGSTNVCWSKPDGTSMTYTTTGSIPVHNTFTSTIAYTGTTGTQWYVMGYCLEVDTVGQILTTVPEGSHEAELDCDNGQGKAGNSSISTKAYLAVGNYELRYNYASRVDYPNYDPVYICGSAASDVSWANDTNSSGWNVSNASRTNQINVYLDLNYNGIPPTHATIDGSQTLAGSNLIDMCVHSNSWIERSVRIKVTTAGYYWLSFAADGKSDSYGGQIDNIRLCIETCTTSLQDNFPSTWLAANNGGVNKVLFEDTFESPGQTFGCSNCGVSNVNLYASQGTSGKNSGWPLQSASGWAIGPYNQIDYYYYTLSDGTTTDQYIELDAGLNTIYGTSTTESTSNRSISRAFLLAPGYYQVNYNYISDMLFSSASTSCTAAPSKSNLSTYNSWGNGTGTATSRISGHSYGGISYNTNFIGVFVANGQLVSTPNISSTTDLQTTYTNPDTTTAASYSAATAPLDYVNLSNYSASQSNPLIDFCAYASSWQARTAYIEITKPAYYWLTLSAMGQSDKAGGAIDDVKITALGSLYMSSPPSNAVLIPVPDPQNGATTSFTGFSIISDPLTPPAAMQ